MRKQPAVFSNLPDSIVTRVCDYAESENINALAAIPLAGLQDRFLGDMKEWMAGETALRDALEDPAQGIVHVDFTLPDGIPAPRDLVVSTCLFHLVNASLYAPATEPKNKTPYTVYKSSAEKPQQMKDAGIKFYKPDEKLGFHNDVFYKNGRYFIPSYVSLINLFIGYRNPGDFYYIGREYWADFKELSRLGRAKRFRFRPTPVVYESALQNSKPLEKWTEVPAFWEENGTGYAFANGELVDMVEGEAPTVETIRNSLLGNGTRTAVPQKTHRVMVFRNDAGFHSRDIFQDQYKFEGVTRLFLRAVSEQNIQLPQQIQGEKNAGQ